MMAAATTTLFLSRLILDPRSRQVRSELAQPYEMHRTLMRAFEKSSSEDDTKARERCGVLFRADVDERRNRVIVYVQSAAKPDWSFLCLLRGYLLADGDRPNPAWKDVTVAYQSLENGQVLSFRLRANPTKRIAKVTKGDSELKGKRVGLLREEEQIAWLIRKGESGGFEILMNEVEDKNGELRPVPRVTVRCEGKQRGRKKEKGLSCETTHLAVCFDGLLRITDVNAFRETLVRGIGPGKAFGFGLLSVAPVKPSLPAEAT